MLALNLLVGCSLIIDVNRLSIRKVIFFEKIKLLAVHGDFVTDEILVSDLTSCLQSLVNYQPN